MSDDTAAASATAASRSSRDIVMRYYENDMPELNELVYVKFTAMTDNSAYVQLTEYANIQGMITFSELHRGRITSINQYASVGREETMVVIRMDRERRYIDLSKRTLKTEDKDAGKLKAMQGKEVLNYMCTIADTCNVPLQDMMEKVAWPLYAKFPISEGMGGALAALKLAVTKSDEIFGPLDISKKVRVELDRLVQAKLKPKVRKYECEVSVTCKTLEGVESIQEVLMAGQKASNGQVIITVSHLKASPHYTLRTMSFDRESALRLLVSIVQMMQELGKSLEVTVEQTKDPADVSDAPPPATRP